MSKSEEKELGFDHLL
ncbi:hypothetical protein A2U01_0072715, partial [Trifolium medium]|nr:hypothetical protein [Trifolium medium]